MFIAHEPQIPSRHERRKVRVGSSSFLILISASRTCGARAGEPPRSPFRKERRRQTAIPSCAPLRCARRTHHGAALVQVDLVVLVPGLRPHLVRIVPIDREDLSTRTVAHRATVSQLYSRPATKEHCRGKGDVRCAHCPPGRCYSIHQPSSSHRGADRGGPAGQHAGQNDAVQVRFARVRVARPHLHVMCCVPSAADPRLHASKSTACLSPLGELQAVRGQSASRLGPRGAPPAAGGVCSARRWPAPARLRQA